MALLHYDLLTAPTAEPVTLAEVKDGLKIDDTRYDSVLPRMIAAARVVAEGKVKKRFVEQTWRYELDAWPSIEDVFDTATATAVAVSYWDGSTWQTVSTDDYIYSRVGAGTSIAPITSWPAYVAKVIGETVRVDITAGVATAQASTVADAIKTYIIALVGQTIANPELNAKAASESNPYLDALLRPYAVY